MVLITGGTGMLGYHFLQALTPEKQSVKALYRCEKRLENIKRLFERRRKKHLFSKILWTKASLEDKASLEKAFQGVQQVYHLAALVSFKDEDNHKMMQVNYKGTENIVQLCLQYKVKKLCHVSSVATLKSEGKLIKEQDILEVNRRNSGYALSKYYSEQAVYRGIDKGLEAIILNPSVILGGGFWQEKTGLFFSKIDKGLLFYTKKITGFIGARDIVCFAMKIMKSPIKNEKIILNSENRSIEYVLKTIADCLGKTKPFIQVKPWMAKIILPIAWTTAKLTHTPQNFTKRMAQSINSQRFYSNEKAKNLLDFTFTPIEKVIQNLAREYQKNL